MLVSVLFDILGVGCPVVAGVAGIAIAPGALRVLKVLSIEAIVLKFLALPGLAAFALAGRG